jgi:hypothetical protein
MGSRAGTWIVRFLTLLALLALPALALIAKVDLTFEDVLFGSIVSILFPVLGLVVLERRPGHPVGLAYLAFGLTQAVAGFSASYAEHVYTSGSGPEAVAAVAAWLGTWTWEVGTTILVTFAFLLFPDGHLPSRRWRPVAWMAWFSVLTSVTVGVILIPHAGPALVLQEEWPSEAAENAFLAAQLSGAIPMLFSIGSVFMRFRRATGVERQQIKWLFAAGTLLMVGLLLTFMGPEVVSDIAGVAGLIAVPAASAVAILRYRLYDFDVLINRTLVYGSLTAILIGIYAGGVLLFRALLDPLTGDNDLAIAVSTLAVAGLFGPARRRVQAFIDRRFYRSRYDMQQILQSFSARLRDEVELDAVAQDLRGVVATTMNPAHASVWFTSGEVR